MSEKARKNSVKIGKDLSVTKAREKEMQKKSGGSNVGKYKNLSKKSFCGPAGGAPQGSFPINTKKRAKAALSYARNAPDPEGIKACVRQKYPSLGKKKKK